MLVLAVTALCFSMVALVAACSGSGDTVPSRDDDLGAPRATPEAGAGQSAASGAKLPCDVDAVLAKRCQSCHGTSPSFGAPMSLVTLADLTAPSMRDPSKKVFERVALRIHDDRSPMPQAPIARLDAAETKVLDDWAAAGAPSGSETCGDAGARAGGVQPLSCAPDQKIRPASKFAMNDASDLYVCYGFDAAASAKRHVIAGAPRIDNTKIVHHVLLYQAPSSVSGTPTPCGAGGGAGWRLVTGWAPGGKNFELPPEAGFAEEAGTTHWAVQIHYNNVQGLKGEVDESGYDLCTTDKLRANDADILATGTVQISIPPRTGWKTTCRVDVPKSMGKATVVSSWAHMHKLGRAQSAKRVRAGASTTLLDAPNYDFSIGAGANDVRVDLAPGDTIETTCKWQNPGDKSVSFGESTGDEMCFAFLTYYPKVTSPLFHWALLSAPIISQCTAAAE